MGALDPCRYPRLTVVYATGEAVTPGLVQRRGRTQAFYNAYGPAEASICVSFTRPHPGEAITIGRLDRQVKVRGFRVELPTVGQHIYAADPLVEFAAVLVVNEGLVAVVKPASIDTRRLRARFLHRLQPT